MIAIELMGLTKRYGDILAVDGLDLTIAHGELLALLGVNGAGKTTTIRMLSCLIPPTAGDAKLLGDSIVKAPELVKRKINISPQETAVAPNLTVRENLMFIAGIYGASRGAAVSDADGVIERLSLQSVTNRKARTLSGGWQRRLSIAMALITDPQILFLDEPTLGLDVIARRELWKVIEALKGIVTIILTTHYMEEAESLADRIAIMASGELKAVGTPDELIRSTQTKNFEEAFIAYAVGRETIGGKV